VGYLSPPPSPQPVVVYKDVGGLVSEYEAQTESYRQENREVRLHECRSACTLALSLPNVCVYPDAKVKFHQAYNAITHEADLGVSSRLFNSYPAAVQGRLGYLTRQYKVLTGVELIALGMRNCLRDDRLMVAQNKRAPAQPPAEPNSLRQIAQNVQVAVAGALQRADDAPPEPIRVSDRSPVPPALARLAGDAATRADKTRTALLAAPQPPRRPDFEPQPVVAASKAPLGRLIVGAQPMLDASGFAAPIYSLRAEAEPPAGG
jgi:hypothetical protein